MVRRRAGPSLRGHRKPGQAPPARRLGRILDRAPRASLQVHDARRLGRGGPLEGRGAHRPAPDRDGAADRVVGLGDVDRPGGDQAAPRTPAVPRPGRGRGHPRPARPHDDRGRDGNGDVRVDRTARPELPPGRGAVFTPLVREPAAALTARRAAVPYTAAVIRWIRTAAELSDLAGSLRGRRAVALDTESDSLHHHREKVCLLQVGLEEGGWLVDPLAVRDLSPLSPLLADPATVKVLHGADYDVTTLKRDFGFAFEGLFDTMIAARFLGLPEIGLQALLRTEFGIGLTKESQKDDWSRRPLTPTQEAYALADVTHLIALYERLAARLQAAGRLEWAREESAAVAALEAARRGRDPEAWQKIK